MSKAKPKDNGPMQHTDGTSLETQDHTANDDFFKPVRTTSK